VTLYSKIYRTSAGLQVILIFLMTYSDLLQLYFHRSNALQWYWTVYVVVIGGLLAFSSLRQRPHVPTAILVSVLYVMFAYKNLGAIHDVTMERYAILAAIREYAIATPDSGGMALARQKIEPTLQPPAYEGVRTFHIASDVLTLAAIWAMEWRRMRAARLAVP
jgi:hypothetical protein